MSKTIDEKVVEMRFDNKDFEKNVSKSLKSIDELKFKLQTMDFRTNVKSLDELGNAIGNVNMSPLENGIETVRAKFSALQIIGITALQNITNSAINAGRQIANSLTNSLIEGGKQRALKIKDAKFQMEGLLGTEEYAKQWDRIDESINYAVKDTAYGYDSAARAASQFLASNVKVGEQMDRSLRAISGVAAMTNSTYDDIANIFTRVSGQGRVMANDLNSLAARGLNAAAMLGKSMGKSEAQIRDMVSKGKISFDDFAKAMDDAFGAHAKKGNETFSGSLANMKAAMSRIGAKIWDPLLDNEKDVFNQMRLLINDLNGNYLDGPIKVLNGRITEAFQSIVQFFEKGGVKNVLLGIGNTLKFLSSVIKPIKEVFREIFPKKSVDTLVSYTVKFKEFTEKLKLSEETANNIKNIFKGFFSVIDTGITIISKFIGAIGKLLSNLTGIPGGILGVLGAFGEWISKISESVKNSKLFNDVLENTINIFDKIINKIREFISKVDIFDGLYKILSYIFNGFKEFFSFIGSKIINLKSVFETMNTGIFGLILLNIGNITKSLDLFFRKVEKFNTVGNIGQILATVRSNLYEMTFNIKAKTLMEIAKAIVLLAGGLLILSMIDPGSLAKALGGMAILIKELMQALSSFMIIMTFDKDNKASIIKGAIALTAISASLLILAGALKILSSIGLKEMAISLGAVTLGIQIMIRALKMLPENDVRKAAKALKSMGTALVIFSIAMKILSTIDWDKMKIGLFGLVVGLDAMVVAINNIDPEKAISKTFSMILLANSLIIMAGALKILATMDWDDIGRSLTVLAGALAALVTFINTYDGSKSISKAFSMILLTSSLLILGKALQNIAKMDWHGIGRSLGAIAGSMLILVTAMNLMSSNVLSSAAFLVMASSLIILAEAIKLFGSIDPKIIAKGLLAIASSFIVLGLAGSVLGVLSPLLLVAAGAMALFGLASIALGKGLVAISAGILAFTGAISGSVDIIVGSILGIISGINSLIPELIDTFWHMITSFYKVILETAPLIAHTILGVIYEILKELDDYGPKIIDVLIDLFVKLIDSLAKRMPELMTSIMNLAGVFIQSFIDALNNLNPDTLSKMIEGVKGLSIVMMYLAALSYLAPAAAKGIIEFGLLAIELGAVLSILGGLSKIPGLEKAITLAGDLLQKMGEAIGKFVAGLAKGATSTLPDVGKNISDFMVALKPFLEGVKDVDNNIFDKTKILCNSIKKLAGANFISGLSKITGSNLKTVGKDLSDFIENMKPFFEVIKKIDSKILEGVDMLSTVLIKITESNLLNSVTQLLPGNNSLKKFGEQLKYLGEGVNGFVKEITKNISSDSIGYVETVCEIVKLLSEIFDNLPDIKGEDLENKGWGLGSAIGHLANGISYFSAKIKDIDFDENRVTSISKFIKDISEVFSNLPDINGEDLENKGWGFSSTIGHLANGISYFSAKINECSLNEEKITSAANSIKTLSEVIPNISKYKGPDLENVGWGFGSTIGHLANGISYFSAKINECNLNEGLVTTACNSIKIISETIPNISNVDGIALENKGWAFGSLIGHLANGISYFSAKINECGLNEANVTTACNSIKTISETIPNISEVKGEDLESKGWGFGSLIGHLANGISYFSAKINECNLNEANITAACNSIKSLSEVFPNLPDINGSDLENKGWGFGSAIGHLANGISYFSAKINECGLNESLITAACNSSKSLSEVFSNLPDINGGDLENKGWGFGSAIGHLGNGLSVFFNNLTNIGLDTIEEGITKVNELISMATSIASINVESLNTFSDSLIKVATEGVDGFCKAFSDLEPKDKVKQATMAMIGAAILGAEETLPKLVDKFKSACSDILTYIATQYEAMRGVGLYFTQGFEQGIKEGTGPVVEAARAMAANAVIAAKQAIDSNSPSKETMKLGNYFGSGFAIGIKEYFGKVYDTAYDSGNIAKEGLSNAISKISSIVEDGIDTNPTIRPVLDLSDVEAGASYLGSMFGTNSIGVNNNLNSISNGFNSRIQNGGSDILSAIKNLETTILTKCGNTTNIYTQELDSAKLDQIVAHVNREFGIMY